MEIKEIIERPPSSMCECENTDDYMTYDFMCARCAEEDD